MLMNMKVPGSGGSLTVVTVGSGSIDAGYFTDEDCTVEATPEWLATAENPTVYHKLISVPSWSTGTDAEICAAIELADAGEIDLTKYWSVGDKRTVSLSAMAASGVGESHAAQNIELVLMNAGGKELVTPTSSGRTECSFVVGMKGVTTSTGYMNSTKTNSGGWNSSARRTWCNNVFKNAVPSTLLPIFKQVKITTGGTGTSSSAVSSEDYFFLPAEKEVFGSNSYANSTAESSLSQFTWYKTSSNRLKERGTTTTKNSWWLRSSASGSRSAFVPVSTSGEAGLSTASNSYALSVHGCI